LSDVDRSGEFLATNSSSPALGSHGDAVETLSFLANALWPFLPCPVTSFLSTTSRERCILQITSTLLVEGQTAPSKHSISSATSISFCFRPGFSVYLSLSNGVYLSISGRPCFRTTQRSHPPANTQRSSHHSTQEGPSLSPPTLTDSCAGYHSRFEHFRTQPPHRRPRSKIQDPRSKIQDPNFQRRRPFVLRS
jgi:hypothetical protein